jgi:hypothetical protein
MPILPVLPDCGGISMKLGIFLIVLLSVLVLLCGCNELQLSQDFLAGKQAQPYVAKMLIIGSPSADTLAALGNCKDLAEYTIRDGESLRDKPSEKLADYNIVMLDQSNQESKSLPSAVGEALSDYVAKGGKLVVVMDSGILSPDAPEIVGWTANFGSDIVPVDCVYTRDNKPSCRTPIKVTAVLERSDYDHPIMAGIDRVPEAKGMPPLYLEVFPVSATGKEIATVKDSKSTKYYAGIVEEPLLFGKSLYFNYDPGLTPGILRNTLKYLQ